MKTRDGLYEMDPGFEMDWDAEAERAAAIVKDGYTDYSSFIYFKDLVKPDSVVLELGCNIASWSASWRSLAKYIGINISYIGIDFSKTAIDIAKQRYPDYKFLYMDAKMMDFNNEIDIIFTHTMLQHVSLDTKKILAPKMLKALKPDGIMILQENASGKSIGVESNWDTIQGWVDFYEVRGFKSVRNHEMPGGGAGMIFEKADKTVTK